MKPEPEPPEKPSVAWGVFNGLGLFFIVLPLGLLVGVIALMILMATFQMLMPWLWLLALFGLFVWKRKWVAAASLMAIEFVVEFAPIVFEHGAAGIRKLCLWPFRKIANGARRFVNYLKTGYATLD
jgi:hypothetical protein